MIVIDIRKGITDNRLYSQEEFIRNTVRVMKAACDHQIEVIYFKCDDGPGTVFSAGDPNFEIVDQAAP